MIDNRGHERVSAEAGIESQVLEDGEERFSPLGEAEQFRFRHRPAMCALGLALEGRGWRESESNHDRPAWEKLTNETIFHRGRCCTDDCWFLRAQGTEQKRGLELM